MHRITRRLTAEDSHAAFKKHYYFSQSRASSVRDDASGASSPSIRQGDDSTQKLKKPKKPKPAPVKAGSAVTMRKLKKKVQQFVKTIHMERFGGLDEGDGLREKDADKEIPVPAVYFKVGAGGSRGVVLPYYRCVVLKDRLDTLHVF